MDAMSAAKVFLLCRGRNDNEEDLLALTNLLELFAKVGFVKGLKTSKDIILPSVSCNDIHKAIDEMIERYKV